MSYDSQSPELAEMQRIKEAVMRRAQEKQIAREIADEKNGRNLLGNRHERRRMAKILRKGRK